MSRSSAALALLLLWGASSGASYEWMRRNGCFDRPPPCDAAAYRLDVQRLNFAWARGGLLGLLKEGLDHPHPHPPLLPMIAAPVVDPSRGVRPVDLWFVIQLFNGVFLAAAYRLSRNFLGRGPALAAAAIAASAPWVIVALRPFYPQFPMAAAATSALDLVLRSRGFTRYRYAVAAGVAAGAATMLKMLAPIYLVGALLAAPFFDRPRGVSLRRSFGGAAAALCAAALVGAPWYGTHYDAVLRMVGEVVGPEGQATYSGGVGLADVERWLYYPKAWVNEGVGFAMAVLSVGGAALLWRRRGAEEGRDASRRGGAAVLACAAITGYVATSFGQINGGPFYILPFAAPAALVPAAAASSLKGRPGRRAAAAAIAACCVANHVFCARDFASDVVRGAFGPFQLVGRYDQLFGNLMTSVRAVPRVGAEPWPNRPFVEEMLLRAPGPIPCASHTAPHHFVEVQVMAHDAAVLGEEIRWASIGPALSALTDGRRADAARATEDVDFLIVHEGEFRIPLSGILSAASELGREAVVLRREDRTPFTTFALVALGTPGALQGFQEAKAADAADFVPLGASFDGGPRAAAFARRTSPDGGPMFVCLFDAAGIVDEARVGVELRAKGRPTVRAERRLRPLPRWAPRLPYFAATFEFPKSATETRRTARLAVLDPATGARRLVGGEDSIVLCDV